LGLGRVASDARHLAVRRLRPLDRLLLLVVLVQFGGGGGADVTPELREHPLGTVQLAPR
jgi:hypothetical protein